MKWFRSLFGKSTAHAAGQSKGRKRRAADRRRDFRRAVVESLEDRALMALLSGVSYDVGDVPRAVASGDFNGDGHADLVAANYSSSSVSVLLGNAAGTFTAAGDFATGVNPRSVAVGDFNNDGRLDVATANYGANNVSILLGNGAGGLAAPSNVAVENPSSVAVGDLNGDGKLDLVVGGHTSYYIPPWGGCGWYGYCYGGGGYWVNQPRVTVLLGTGDGGIGTQNAYDLWYYYSWYSGNDTTPIAVADVNGDNRTDVVAGQNPIQVMLGNGNGTLQSPTYSAGYGTSIAVADVDGDGKLDLLATSGGSIGVSLGNGLGSFGITQYFPAGGNLASVAASDFNGDGKVDLVASDQSGSAVHVLLGAGAGIGSIAFKPPLTAAAGSQPAAAVVGDFNRDGRADVATANAGSGDVSVLLNDGNWPSLDVPSISINDVTVTEGNTGSVNATFTVTLSASYSQNVTVNYATGDHSWSPATAGIDYQGLTGQITIPAGQTSASLSIPVYGDRIGESTEYFVVNLTNATNAFIADGQGIGTILDDEPRITIDSSASAAEGNDGTTPIDFKVRLSAASDAEVRVNFSTVEGDMDDWCGWYYGWYCSPYGAATVGSDFEPQAGTLIFAPGEIEKTISILAHGDRIAEPTELFYVDLSDPVGARMDYGRGVGFILDDEPTAWITGTTITEGNTGTTEAVFTVTLSAASDVPITVDYATVNWGNATAGVDYQVAQGTLTFDPGQTSKPITVLVTGDTVAEYTESFYVELTGATGAHAYSSASATIVDDDPHMTINDVTLSEGDSGVTWFVFTVSLSTASDGVVTVDYETFTFWDWHAQPGSDYEAQNGTLVFAPGETSKTISIAVYGDTKQEADENFWVSLSNITGNAILYGDYQGTGTILNDDAGGGGGKGKGHGKGGKPK